MPPSVWQAGRGKGVLPAEGTHHPSQLWNVSLGQGIAFYSLCFLSWISGAYGVLVRLGLFK